MYPGVLLGLRQFLITGSPLKITKKAFYFALQALFVLRIFIYLFWFFGYVGKLLGKKAMFNFHIYDVTDWETNNFNTRIAQFKELKATAQWNLVS